jgi:hypothetical protein
VLISGFWKSIQNRNNHKAQEVLYQIAHQPAHSPTWMHISKVWAMWATFLLVGIELFKRFSKKNKKFLLTPP